MRIITQNRLVSVSFSHVDVITFGSDILADRGEKHVVLGRYESEERANEVFVEIHNAYLDKTTLVFLMPEK